MKTFANAQEIIELKTDFPVFMLAHVETPSLEVQNELKEFLSYRISLEEDDDPYWDLKMGNSLTFLAKAQHPEAMDACLKLYHWVQDASPYLQGKILRLIENVLDPEVFASETLPLLSNLSHHSELYLSVLALNARSKTLGADVEKKILDYWKEEPFTGLKLMGLSRNALFLPLIENELKKLAPFLRYIPVLEGSHLYQHDLWSETATTWFEIAWALGLTPEALNPKYLINESDPTGHLHRHREWQEQLDAYLLDKFGSELPWSEEEWLMKLPANSLKESFMAAKQQLQLLTMPGKKRLQLVQPTHLQ